MPLSRGTVNPLGVLGLRRLSFIPEHFATLTIESYRGYKEIENWINYNLNSRYAIKRKLAVNDQNKLTEMLEIGIEDPAELTMLSLGCPHLHNKREDLF